MPQAITSATTPSQQTERSAGKSRPTLKMTVATLFDLRSRGERAAVVTDAFLSHAADVRSGHLPAPEHCYPIEPVSEAEIHATRVAGARPAASAAGTLQ